jgi:hypothetical protein
MGVAYSTHMEEVGSPGERDHLEKLDVDGKIILR